MFDPVDAGQSFPDLELGILKYWREEDVFKRSMSRRKDGEVFSFYDGPPFATGLPHYGHILAGTIKDVIPRYQTMRGKHVKRREAEGGVSEIGVRRERGLGRIFTHAEAGLVQTKQRRHFEEAEPMRRHRQRRFVVDRPAG